jgi:hypothetical protein
MRLGRSQRPVVEDSTEGLSQLLWLEGLSASAFSPAPGMKPKGVPFQSTQLAKHLHLSDWTK